MTSLRRLGGLLAPYRKRILFALALTVLACVLSLPIPLLMQALVDQVLQAGRVAVLPWILLSLLFVYLAQAGANLTSGLVIGRVGLEVVRELRHRLYHRLQRFSLAYYDKTPAGAILARVMDDVAAVQGLVTSQTLTILTDLGTTAVILIWFACCHPLLLAVVVSFIPLHVVVFRWFTHRIRAGTDQVRVRLDTIFGHLKEKLDGMLIVKASGREQGEMAEFAAQLSAAHEPRVRVGRLGAAFANVTAALSGAGAVLVFAVAAVHVLEGRMTPGAAVSATALAVLIFGPVARLADLASTFEQASASIDRLGEILDREPEMVEARQPLAISRLRGGVEFDQVGFGYEAGQPVIWDIRLSIEPGMKVALVGPTGCGKSTLVNLLLRFYDPTWGEIRLDGVPLRDHALADLRRQIGVVPQEPIVFRQSLADNIRYGCPAASDAQVEAAARAALVHDFACQLPEGYATIVGEGGYKLSQGQRQRIAIARAFCKNPALVVLDEATSSLDTPSELLIQKALADLLVGRTALIVAHRLSTVRRADRIVVMEAGEIVQIGTHRELLADADGLYFKLCSSQFGRPDPGRQAASTASSRPFEQAPANLPLVGVAG